MRRDHTEGMNSRVYPTYKTKYRVANWASYDRALVGRGDVTLWVSPEAIATWAPAGVGTRGGQRQYSDVAIETALTLRLLFHLPLRQTEGFLHSLFGMMGLELVAPDHTTLSRRGQHLDLTRARVPTGKGLHLIVDSTGLSIVGEGEWARAKHRLRGTRGWKKLHLGVDRSGVIIAHALTEATVDDATTAIELIKLSTAALRASRGTRPTTRSPSTMPRARVARPSWCHRPRGYLDGSRGRALAIARFGRCTRSDDDGGRRRLATIGRPVWRTPSSGTSRS